MNAADTGQVLSEASLLEFVRGVWKQVLNVSQIQDDDNFFRLGGQSLTAVLTLAEIKQEFGVEVPIGVAFERPVLRDFVQTVAVASKHDGTQNRRSLRAFEAAGADAPMSFQQAQLWTVYRISGESRQYNVPLAYRLHCHVDPGALQRSVQRLAQRHAVLRTTYGERESQLVQTVHDTLAPAFAFTDLSDLTAPERERRERALIDEFQNADIDLSCESPLVIHVVRTAHDCHLLLIMVHHIAFDGWSVRILLDELAAIYSAETTGRVPDLPELSVQYADFARWSRERAGDPDQLASLEYFRRYLDGAEALNTLLPDIPRTANSASPAGMLRDAVAPALAGALKAAAHRQGSTLFVLMYSALAVLLYRYTGRPDVVVGVPMANREEHALLGLVGFFANTIVLRSKVQPAQTFDEFVRDASANVQNTFAHQHTPFPLVVEALQPPRSASHNPFFQIAFAFQNSPASAAQFAGGRLIPVPVANAKAKFDVTVYVVLGNEGIDVEWEYDASLFSAETIAGLVRRYRDLLVQVAANDPRPIAQLLPLTDEHDMRTLARLEQAPLGAHSQSLPEIFRRVARQNPEKTAVVWKDVRIDYATLDRCSDILAARLLSAGVRAGQPVALSAVRDPGAIVAVLAILKAEAAYIPIDVGYPAARVDFMLRNSGAVVFLHTSSSPAPALPATTIGMAVDWSELARAKPSVELPEVRGVGRRAYMMYTSGSTGTPKGVWVGQAGIVRLVQDNGYCPLDADTVMLHAVSPGFDTATFEIWGALLNAGTLVLYGSERFDMDEVVRLLRTHAVNTMWLTAGLLEAFAYALSDPLPSLKWLVAGGDVVSPTAVQRLHEHQPGLTVVNGYGPTENTTFTCCHVIQRGFDARRSVSIGRPIAGTHVRIVTADGIACAVDMPGELWTTGDGVAEGYHGAPDLTAAKFVRTASSPLVWYRTGDLVRLRATGEIEFLGRIDQQVKIRGFRIEIGDVESQMAAHPGVRSAAVVIVGDDAANKALVGFVTPVGGAVLDAVVLRQWLAGRLPGFAIPARVHVVDELPVNVNGKIDRQALISLHKADLTERGPESHEFTSVETEIAALWNDAIGDHACYTPASNFFDFGGTSISAIRLATLLAKHFGKPISTSFVYDNPTLREMALPMYKSTTRLSVFLARGKGPVWFGIPGVGGLFPSFTHIARTFGSHGHQFAAFDSLGIRHPDLSTERYGTLVDALFEEIMELQSSGPWQLIGHSFGARVAYDLAALLEATGKTVRLLLLDGLPANDLLDLRKFDIGSTDADIARWLLRGIGDGSESDSSDPVAALSGSEIYGFQPLSLTLANVRRQIKLNQAYSPQRRLNHTRVHLLYATAGLLGKHASREEIAASLRAWARNSSVSPLQADHFSMLQQGDAITDAALRLLSRDTGSVDTAAHETLSG